MSDNNNSSGNNGEVRPDLKEAPPHDCPGTQSEGAGKASACAGCPNQQVLPFKANKTNPLLKLL